MSAVQMPSDTTHSLHTGENPDSTIHLDPHTEAEADGIEYSSASESDHETTDSSKERREALRRKWDLKMQRYREEEKAATQQEEMKERYKSWEMTESEWLERVRLSLLDGTLRCLDSIAQGTGTREADRSTYISVFEDPQTWAGSAASKSANLLPKGFRIKQTMVSCESEPDDTRIAADPSPFSSFAVTFIGDQNTAVSSWVLVGK
jgi:hypothetical protein